MDDHRSVDVDLGSVAATLIGIAYRLRRVEDDLRGVAARLGTALGNRRGVTYELRAVAGSLSRVLEGRTCDHGDPCRDRPRLCPVA